MLQLHQCNLFDGRSKVYTLPMFLESIINHELYEILIF